MRFVFLTMDGNHGAALRRATAMLRERHGVTLDVSLYNATQLRSADDLAALAADVRGADFVFGSMLFGEDLVRPLESVLAVAACPVCIITSNPNLIYTTKLGKLQFKKREESEEKGGLGAWAKKFRPKRGSGHGGESQRQLAMLRNVSKVLAHIPGKARDLHTYIAAHDYWLNGSPENLLRLLCLLIGRYVPSCKAKLPQLPALQLPTAAIYHPDAPAPFADLAAYRAWRKRGKQTFPNGAAGLLSLRTVVVTENTAHLDATIRALEARGIEARCAYGSGLDFRPAMETFFREDGKTTVDAVLNAAGFSLVGGMAESRPEEARAALEATDTAYLDLIPLAFQRVEEWERDDTGLSPIQLAMNVAVPELDGSAEPIVYGGPVAGGESFVPLPAQIAVIAGRVAKRVALRRAANADKRVAVVLFNFPPNLGNIGTAAYLDVFASLHRLLSQMRAEGYGVEVPPTPDALRRMLVEGNALRHGTDGNVHTRFAVTDYRRLFPAYRQIEPLWGTAPGELLNDGKAFHILGAQLGNVFVGLQPSFGYERDPMRLLMAKDAAPHHGFAAFYTWLDQVFGAHAVVHFGTHGALEFMPGKQVGLSADCWPVRLLGSLPNFYYYSVNNPSEAVIAKRRGLATLVSYMVPPLQQAGLYKGLRLLKDALDSYRARPSEELLADIRVQADKLEITLESNPQTDEAYVAALAHELLLIEQRMIPLGLHVLGEPPAPAQLVDMLALVAAFAQPDAKLPTLPRLVAASLGYDYEGLRDRLKSDHGAQARWEQMDRVCRETLAAFVVPGIGGAVSFAPDAADAVLHAQAGMKPGTCAPLWAYLADLTGRINEERELAGLMGALAGRYTPPSPGNDVVRNHAIVPTGRNIHGLDPYRVPSPVAQDIGARLMTELLERQTAAEGKMPETVAMVLWGTDNLKSEGEGVAQVLALVGTRVVLDELGKVADVALIPLDELKRPRVDVCVTVSGIFRDLLYHQMGLMDKAVRLAAEADEPDHLNFVRKHVHEEMAAKGVDAETAATRVFSNSPGSYGANVNHLVESSTWEDEAQLSEAFLARKSFAYAGVGKWADGRAQMEHIMGTVDLAFQNVDSFEVGITDIDHYYENLGGVTKSVELARGTRPPVVLADAISQTGRLSSLEQTVRLETRAKMLNPKWYEAMLAHGYEGVSEIETRVGNTFGWSATADAVEGWVYTGVAETFLLDEAMRDRLAAANPHATASMTRRLLEANNRGFWQTDEATLAALQEIYSDLEDRLEGVGGNGMSADVAAGG